MFKSHRFLGIIPARAGSKGLPGKNMLPCAGKPLARWTMEAAADSKYIDATVVSSDWDEILDLARYLELGRVARAPELAVDFAPLSWVIKDAWLREGAGFDYAVVLQPTSPTRSAEDIDNSIEHYFAHRKSDSDTLASVCEVVKAGWLMEPQRGYAAFCFPPKPNRQNLTPYYRPNGAIFILSQPFEFYRRCIPFVMPPCPDIDTQDELDQASAILLARTRSLLLT